MREQELPDGDDWCKEAQRWNRWRSEALHWFLQHGVETNLAEDMAQEVLLRLLRRHNCPQTFTRTYLHKVCHSVLCDYLRHCQREPVFVSMDGCSPCTMAEMGYDDVEDCLLLQQALAQLSERERQIVILHYLEGEPYEAIARCLGNGATSEGVKKTCQRAIKKLQHWARSQE